MKATAICWRGLAKDGGACAGAANYFQSGRASLAILIGSLAASCRQVGSQPHAFSMAGRPAPTAGLAVLAHATCACSATCPLVSRLFVLLTCMTANLSKNFTAMPLRSAAYPFSNLSRSGLSRGWVSAVSCRPKDSG